MIWEQDLVLASSRWLEISVFHLVALLDMLRVKPLVELSLKNERRMNNTYVLYIDDNSYDFLMSTHAFQCPPLLKFFMETLVIVF